MKKFANELKRAALSVLPVAAIVGVLHLTLTPLPPDLLILFGSATLTLIVGMALFSLGAETAMMPIGHFIGAHLTRTNRMIVLLPVAFVLGFIITMAEPDLQILATQIPSIPKTLLIASVAAGVGLFLMLTLLRYRFRLNLAWLLIGFYGLVFLVAWIAPASFTALAFDSGGVTTGPVTVPFILALSVGLASVLGGNTSHDSSFGMVALCSVGPVLMVLILGIFYQPDSSATIAVADFTAVHSIRDVLNAYSRHLLVYVKVIGFALSPIAAVFLVFQVSLIRLAAEQLIKLSVGMVYTFAGLVLFLTSANVGFLPSGYYLGEALAGLPNNYLLLPIGGMLGLFIVVAEPAVTVLTHQIWDMTGGSIAQSAIKISMSISVAISVILAVTRLLFDFSIWYLLLPGYFLALLLTFFAPPIFTAIAFDAGGVASGPMTATFLLPFTAGIGMVLGDGSMANTFGLVAMVAMTPLITIQVLGMIYKHKLQLSDEEEAEALAGAGADADEEYVELEYSEEDES